MTPWIDGTSMSAEIAISIPGSAITPWKKQISDASEFQRVWKIHVPSEPVLDFVKAAFVPVRSNSLRNFTIDLFLPTAINQALQIQRVAGRIFAFIGALLFDLLTLAVRLVTAIPWLISNCTKGEHELVTYLKEQAGFNRKLLRQGYLKLSIRTFSNVGFMLQNQRASANEQTYKKICNCNFVRVPWYPGWQDEAKTDQSRCSPLRGPWGLLIPF